MNPDLKISKYKTLSDKIAAEEEGKLKAGCEPLKIETGEARKPPPEGRRAEDKRTVTMCKNAVLGRPRICHNR